ncbi:RDD family protein [Humibacter sp.]|uniref:RDD family protein n=1 Tax=Humibacter sp. TaxID=1940291 RepID=UPI002CFAC62B|nr:RDD family protein [Humibacter sp.]HVX07611.1 RDD family protein [Humibacter sp.]
MTAPWDPPAEPPQTAGPSSWSAPAPGTWGDAQPEYGAVTGYGAPPGYSASSPYGPLPANLATAGQRFGATLLELVLAIATLIIGWVIWDLIAWTRGQTPAKQLLGLRIVSAQSGQPLSWGQSFVRNFLCYGLLGSIPLLGFIYRIVGACFVFNPDRQALWDRMAKTYVVSERRMSTSP